MKIKEGFLLRDVAGNHVVVPVGQVDFDGMIKLNETGAFLWNLMSRDTDADHLVNALLSEYNVDRSAAAKDVEAFLQKLRNAELLDE